MSEMTKQDVALVLDAVQNRIVQAVSERMRRGITFKVRGGVILAEHVGLIMETAVAATFSGISDVRDAMLLEYDAAQMRAKQEEERRQREEEEKRKEFAERAEDAAGDAVKLSNRQNEEPQEKG